jgi:hypothetical protein
MTLKYMNYFYDENSPSIMLYVNIYVAYLLISFLVLRIPPADPDSLLSFILIVFLKIVFSDRLDILKKYDYIHEQMELTNAQILEFPNLLTTRLWRLKQRHEFLKFLGRANYEPSKDLFVSPKTMIEGSDKEFVLKVANSSLSDYNVFLKTL